MSITRVKVSHQKVEHQEKAIEIIRDYVQRGGASAGSIHRQMWFDDELILSYHWVYRIFKYLKQRENPLKQPTWIPRIEKEGYFEKLMEDKNDK